MSPPGPRFRRPAGSSGRSGCFRPAEIDPTRLRLLTDAATANASAGAFEQTLVQLEEALGLLPDTSGGRRAELIVWVADTKRKLGRPFESRDLLTQTLESLPEDDTRLGIGIRMQLAMDAFFGGDFLRMRELADHILRAAGQDQLLLTSAATLRVLADHAAGRIHEAMATLAQAESAFASIEDGELLRFVDLAGLVALAAMRLERADRGLDHLRRAKALANLSGQRAGIPGWLAMETWLLLLKGRVTEALRVAETAVDAAVVSREPPLRNVGLRGRFDGGVSGWRHREGTGQRTGSGGAHAAGAGNVLLRGAPARVRRRALPLR